MELPGDRFEGAYRGKMGVVTEAVALDVMARDESRILALANTSINKRRPIQDVQRVFYDGYHQGYAAALTDIISGRLDLTAIQRNL